ncbi:aldo/keto reductase [Actinosynnema sp. NPDC047251]|uniref:Putative oxidoreductase n=1 Tax=Saccharothrix espanaensis (strain ATCC 51144 / DSM 44229 / JCM 9112 / NBRC 15066 / NRRL 15764) TaxID=1179773 RepID=K0JWZ0_SACES|nr:aldo/keto reductase [Saccharothrix espanaensis]CCH29927.1 putative oxidoreductase [Saccharothrix espanaensis DSM 44229]
MTTITLNNGVTMPQLGFGVFQVSTQDTEDAVAEAIRVGYRSIDTAAAYGNEEPVGRAVAASGLPRDDLFVTTKLWNTDQGYDEALRAFDTSLGKLGLDRLDLYLIHWPAAERGRYVDSWRALGKLLADGRVRAIGVSNFQVPHLERVIETTGAVPAVNQVELHPRFQQEELRRFHAGHGIATEAWSPLAQGGDLLRDEVVTAIADKHGRTPAQVVLRWHLQLGNVVIPKSVTPSRIAENFAVTDFELDRDDLDRIATLETGQRVGPDPDKFN